jgi:hypothetical protein
MNGSTREAVMWLSFWISVAIGLVAAMPILNRPDLEKFWVFVGMLAATAQSGLVRAASVPKTVTVRYPLDGPIPLYHEVPVQEITGELLR